jgi:hypothetical protein
MKVQRLGSWFIRSSALLVLAGLATVPAHANSEGSFQRTLQTSGSVNMDLQTGSGSIQVHTGGASQVQVTGRIKVTEWFGGGGDEKVKAIQANPPIQQSGNDIRIGRIEDPSLRRNVSISYEIVVPANTQLHSHTGSGSQTIDGTQGTLEVGIGSGELRI